MKGILIGIGSLVLVGVIYNSYQKKISVPPIYIKKKLAKNYNARTIPPFGIYIKESEKHNKALLDHELVHWKQYQDKGLLGYYCGYLKEIIKYGYNQMPMEKEARKNESDYCKENYTECVRKGIAKTVYNPQFRVV